LGDTSPILFRRIDNMQVGEAVVLGASKRPDGAQKIEFDTVCPDAGFERLNVVTGEYRLAVALDRPEQGVLHRFKAVMGTEMPPQPGEKVRVEFFHPGEQAGAH